MPKDNPQKQFVIQQHTTPNGVHWDLMLETEDALWTWRLNIPPDEIKNKPVSAERIHDHPLRFLTYEGPVQNNTGNVTLIDKGKCRNIKQTDNTLLFESQGTILNGFFSLSNTSDAPLWTLQRHPDRSACAHTKSLLVSIALIIAIGILLKTAGPYVFVVNSIPHQTPLADIDRHKLHNNTVDRVEQVSDQAKQNVLNMYAEQDLSRFSVNDKSGSGNLARAILAHFSLNQNIDKCNQLLQKLIVWGRSGSTWQLNKTGDYDFTLIWLTTILYEFGENDEILYPQTRDYLLNVLLTEDGKLDLKVPRSGGLFFDTENHLLMREGSRYLKNQWLKKHGNTSVKYDNDRNGLGDWLEKYLNHMRLHGTYEYNSTPYVVYSILPLMNIADYAESETIRKLAESILDNIAIRFAYGSLNLKQCAPFRRQFKYAEAQGLYMNRFHRVVGFWLDINSYDKEHLMLSAVVHDYTLPVATYELLSERKDSNYFKIFAHGQKGSPEIYSGGKNYLLSAGGAYRGQFAKVISRPIALLLDDDAKELSDCIHINGKGDWRQWNMSGVHHQFAVARGSVFIPERYDYQTKPGWNVVKANASITAAFYQGRELAMLIVLPDLQVPQDQLIQMLSESNPSIEESKQFKCSQKAIP